MLLDNQQSRSELKTICLCMIVRNERHVIRRALTSVRGIIDYWIVCDTGSADGTGLEVLRALHGIPGELHYHEWKNFGHNRTQAIKLAKDKADYTLILDADMVAHTHGEFRSRLEADAYEIRYEGELDYSQPMLLSNRHDWRFVGTTHEYVDASTPTNSKRLDELTLSHLGDGGMRCDKYERDARLLEQSLAEQPDNSRDMFYLAQTYRDLDRYEEALTWYEKRIETGGGWTEERWFARYQAARMRQMLGHDWPVVLNAYLQAYADRPSRLEPLFEIVRHYEQSEEYALGYLFSSVIDGAVPYPDDRLFIERSVYDYQLSLARGVCAFAVGRLAEAIRAFNRVLDADRVPDWARESAIRGQRMSSEARFMAKKVVDATPNRIKVVTTFHNPGHFLDNCIESLLAQDYDNFEVILIDDASTDHSQQKIPQDDRRFRLVRNDIRRGYGWNHHHAVTTYCDADDIVVSLDGDDWLACADALTHVNLVYGESDCWVMYGQFQYDNGEYGISRSIASADDFTQLRWNWCASHLRSYRAGLFHRIADQDPEYSCMKDAHGNWLTSAVDAAVMFPVMELAGFERVCYNDRVLYVYNSENPQSWHHLARHEQEVSFVEVQRKRPFHRIDSYHCTNREGEVAAREVEV
ncbi:MAG TPA: glycosyltransferase [Pyrinomonadaceae bacterium]|nr:glycosyltransferase [Pyrinomonadaceae bacterium]